MKSFLSTLAALEARPGAVVFYNSAVRLLAPGSECLEALRALEESGVALLACVTCLDFYQLRERLAVGRVSNMYEISQRLMGAAKVVTI
jgi:intracellular sulfur oxidation DsrE/DsrF family protein